MKNKASIIINKLIENGFEAYFIGGSVRNSLHNSIHNENLAIKDYDIVTNASYSDIKKLFKFTKTRGEQFKVAIVVIDGIEFEVAQYRGESYPKEGSLRPSEVYAVQTLKEDVFRRDFTINGIAEDVNGNIIDYVNGVDDIKSMTIRTIGNPDERFAEDPLRMLRAFRFVSQMGYKIEEETLRGIEANLHKLSIIPHERVAVEMGKILMGEYVSMALGLMKSINIYEYTFYNSIRKSEFKLLNYFFTQPHYSFIVTIKRIEKLQTYKDISLLYAAMYSEMEWDEAYFEIDCSSFISNYNVNLIKLVLKHKELLLDQTPENLYNLLKDLNGVFNNREQLNIILQMMSRVYDIEFKNKELLYRRLFIKELPFDGDYLLKRAQSFNINEGPWMKNVFQTARAHFVLTGGVNFDLDEIIKDAIKEIEV